MYFSVTKKTQQQYQQAFRDLRELNQLSGVTEKITDFERAAVFEIEEELPARSVKGCFFLFALADWRKLREFGLEVQKRKSLWKESGFFNCATTENDHLWAYLNYFEKTECGIIFLELLQKIEISYMESVQQCDKWKSKDQPIGPWMV